MVVSVKLILVGNFLDIIMGILRAVIVNIIYGAVRARSVTTANLYISSWSRMLGLEGIILMATLRGGGNLGGKVSAC